MKTAFFRLLFALILTPLALIAQTNVQSTTYSSGQTYTVSGPTTITAGPSVLVSSGANVSYYATSTITLSPGFTAASGSYFHALNATAPTPPATYTLTVQHGSGGGLGLASGAVKNISATVPAGSAFLNWTVVTGAGTIGNATASSTTFTMGASNAKIRANFTAAPQVVVTPSVSTIAKGQMVTFTASGGSGVLNYTWTGSASGTGTSKSVSFNTPGAFTVSVQNPANGGFPASNVATARITVLDYTDSAGLSATELGTGTGTAGGIPWSNASTITTGSGYDLRSGRISRSISDFVVAGSVGHNPLTQSRVCISKADSTGDGPLPRSVWITNAYAYTVISAPSSTGATLVYPSGTEIRFGQPSIDGVTSFRASSGGKDRVKIDATNKVTELWLEDGTSILFSNAIATQVRDKNGLSITLVYGADGISSATDASGRAIAYSYDTVPGSSLRRLRRATGSDGQWAEYTWDTSSRITSVAYNDGTSGTYSYYSNGLPDTFRDTRARANMPAVKWTFQPLEVGPTTQVPFALIDEKNPDTLAQVSFREPPPNENWTINTPNHIYSEVRIGGDRTFYFDRQRVTKITNGDGGTVDFSYTAGWLTGITDPLKNPYKYDLEPSIGAIIRQTFPDGSFQDYSYSNAAHPYFLATATNELGNTTTYTRNSNGTVQRIDYPDGSYETWPTYNGFNQPTSHRLRNGATEWWDYDGSGRVEKHWLPSFSTQTDYIGYTYYDAPHVWKDRVKTERDPMGNVTTYEYDLAFTSGVQGTTACSGRGLVTKITHADLTYQTFGYDIYGNKVWEEDELRKRTEYTYDSYNRKTSVKDPELRLTSYDFNITDGVSNWSASSHTSNSTGSITSQDNRITRFTHGDDLRVSSETHGDGTSADSKTTFEYDSNGLLKKRKVQVDSSVWRETTYDYDSRNRKRFEYAPLSRTTQWIYDAAGNVIKTILPDAKFSTKEYDSMNRPTTLVDEMGYVTDYIYTASGQIDVIIDRKGYPYAYQYDASDRKTYFGYPNAVGTPLGSSESWTYYASGKVHDYYNRSGQHLVYTYDNRLREKTRTWDNAAAPTVTTTYYDNSLVWTRSNSTGTLTYGYDFAGLVTSEKQEITGGTTVTNTFGYNVDGMRTSLTVTGESSQGFTYNSRGLLETMSYNGTSNWATFDYYMSGERKTRVSPNGTAASYGYDVAGRLSSISAYKVTGTVNLLKQDFGYDARDRRTYAMRDTAYGDVYEYQADSQLTAFKFGVSRPDLNLTGTPAILDSYVYDENGNRISRSEGGVPTTYTSNALNEYSAVSNGAISHSDGRGNITQWTGWSYSYDAENRLVNASGSGHAFVFAYDAQGRLAKLSDNGAAEYRYYDGGQLFLRKQANGTLIERIIWGPSSDEAIARWSSSYGWHYFHHDPLNSPVVATDTTGAAVERYLYDAYGAATIYDGAWGARSATAIGNEWQFTGQEWMPALGLHNYKNRFYQDDLGRFVQQDPLRFDAGDLNLYRYCYNNTTNLTDPDGRIVPLIIVAVAILAASPDYANAPSPEDVANGNTYDMGAGNRALQSAAIGNVAGVAIGKAVGSVVSKFSSRSAAAATKAASAEATAAESAPLQAAQKELSEELISLAKVSKSKQPAVVVGAVDPATGEAVAGSSYKGFCAERDAASKLGGDPKRFMFTKPVRPRTGEIIPVCKECQKIFVPEQFPLGTPFEP